MSLTVFLDTGPLGILTNPKRPPKTVAAITWAIAMRRASIRAVCSGPSSLSFPSSFPGLLPIIYQPTLFEAPVLFARHFIF